MRSYDDCRPGMARGNSKGGGGVEEMAGRRSMISCCMRVIVRYGVELSDPRKHPRRIFIGLETVGNDRGGYI